MGKQLAKLNHLPDGEEQQKRDEMMKKTPMGVPDLSMWDGKNVDEPPEGGIFHPLMNTWLNGYDVLDYVSLFRGFGSKRRDGTDRFIDIKEA